MPESFNPIKSGRISVPDENYTTLNTFSLFGCLLVCYVPLEDYREGLLTLASTPALDP